MCNVVVSRYVVNPYHNVVDYTHVKPNMETMFENIKKDIHRGKNKSKQVDECGIILFNKNFTKVLIVYQNHSNKWGFPKGKMLDDEKHFKQYFKCASRELNEETGVNFKFISKNSYYKHDEKIIIKNKMLYVVLIDEKHVKYCNPYDTEEIREARWINTNDLCSFIKRNNCNITLRHVWENYMIPR